MSDAAKRAAESVLSMAGVYRPGVLIPRYVDCASTIIDQAADEKYQPLVEAVELFLSNKDPLYEDIPRLSEALRKVKEG